MATLVEIALREEIIESIKNYRIANNFSQEQVSKFFNVERSTYTSWETGRSMPNCTQLCLLARMYNVTVDEFIDKKPVGFFVSSGKGGGIEERYVSQLTDEEQFLIAKYRLLQDESKEKVVDLINSIDIINDENEETFED